MKRKRVQENASISEMAFACAILDDCGKAKEVYDYYSSGNHESFYLAIGEQWLLYSEHMGNGYTKSETVPITRANGRPDTKMFTKWTQRGRLMINEVLNRRGIYANMDLIASAS